MGFFFNARLPVHVLCVSTQLLVPCVGVYVLACMYVCVKAFECMFLLHMQRGMDITRAALQVNQADQSKT